VESGGIKDENRNFVAIRVEDGVEVKVEIEINVKSQI